MPHIQIINNLHIIIISSSSNIMSLKCMDPHDSVCLVSLLSIARDFLFYLQHLPASLTGEGILAGMLEELQQWSLKEKNE